MKKIYHPLVPEIAPGDHYHSREARSQFVAKHFNALIAETVLDVGCFQRDLKAALPGNVHYVGIDLMGKPDLVVDLESPPLPFGNRSFQMVVCIDVLEHLERIHDVFDELCRISAQYVILTLPNCWHGNWRWVLPGVGIGSGKYYGLPIDRPMDRHRWFFNTHEAVYFIKERARKNGLEVCYLDFIVPQTTIKRRLFKLWFGENCGNWVPGTIWAVLKI